MFLPIVTSLSARPRSKCFATGTRRGHIIHQWRGVRPPLPSLSLLLVEHLSVPRSTTALPALPTASLSPFYLLPPPPARVTAAGWRSSTIPLTAPVGGGDASTGGAGPGPEVDAGFEFAFDNEAFSDRELRIVVVGANDAASRKRRREEAEGDGGEDIDSYTVMSTPVLRVETIHVCSAILAAKSNFFRKLFSNGMKESGHRQATVTIAESEYEAFLELLHFIYSGKLAPTEPILLVDILLAADKFEAASCIKLCGQRLIDLPMTAESAVMCLDLPCSISMAPALEEAAKKFLAKRYDKFLSTEFQGELMRISLTGIVAILSRNHPGVASEESVYDFVLRWACFQYPNSEERHKILSSSLLPLVPVVRSMTNGILMDQPSCIVDFTLSHGQCSGLFPSGSIRSPPFYCAGHGFFLSAHGKMALSNFFGLSIEKLEDKGPLRGTIDYEI
ncbi:hypothetical protein VPH35_085067 [Triticum aestivum]